MSQKSVSGIFSQEALNLLTELDDFTHIFAKTQPVYELKSSDGDQKNNFEVSAQHVILPNDVIYTMTMMNNNNHLGSSGHHSSAASNDIIDLGDINMFSIANYQSQQQQQPYSLIKSSSLTSNVVFRGDFDFELEFSPVEHAQNKSANWTYSNELNKIYSKLAVPCPVKIKVSSIPPPGSIIRFVAVYKKDEHKKAIIKRCANHTDCKELNEGHPAPSHFIRVENLNTVYCSDKCKSTSVPYEAPQMASPFTIYLVQFMCYNSCVGGGKKPIEIIATLENNGKILGRQKFDVKVCACPYRDKETEEKSGTVAKVSKKSVAVASAKTDDYEMKQEVEINIIKHSQEVTEEHHHHHQNGTNPEEQVFMLRVVGMSNYQILKNLRDALIAKDKALMIENKNQQREIKYEQQQSNDRPQLSSKQSTILFRVPPDDSGETTNTSGGEMNRRRAPRLQCLRRNESVERFLSELGMKNYFDSFQSAGFSTINELLECSASDIEQMNIAESHTKEILNGISFLKSAFDDQQPSLSQQQSQSRKNNSIEITKLSMKYSMNAFLDNFDATIEDVDLAGSQQQQQHQQQQQQNTTFTETRSITRKRSFNQQQQQQHNESSSSQTIKTTKRTRR